MNILLLGSGGREHAIAWKLAQSPMLTNLYIAPGNAGTLNCGTNLDISETDFEAVKRVVLDKQINMVIVGPEAPLVKGIVDFFANDIALKAIPVIGPDAKGAQLEGSKDFSKQFMEKYKIPTAAYKTFTSATINEAYEFLATLKAPYVLKADGLAAGKGVVISGSIDEAKEELKAMLVDSKFGAASSKVVIEEFLDGIELSVFVLTDGNSYKILPAAKDYKRIGEGDTGLNTGGMGAVSPVPFANDEFIKKVEERVIKPTIEGLKAENINYRGFIFIGLMNVKGEPYVIEYNCRMGDPETEVVIPRIKSDLLELFKAVGEGKLSNASFSVDERTAVTVVLASGGYPEEFEKGKKLTNKFEGKETLVFHSGTKTSNGEIVTSGGRVMAITSFGKSIKDAARKSMEAAEKISFDNKYYRKDIGKDLMYY